MYTVTRQIQWPDGGHLVEVSAGGFDYTNPDALVSQFARLGEGETFVSPVKAVEAAIAVCEAWRADGCPEAQIGHGATGGMTMPFDPCTFEEARAWAEATEKKLLKCDRCGELLPREHYSHPDGEGLFCREYCAEVTWQEQLSDSNEEEVEP